MSSDRNEKKSETLSFRISDSLYSSIGKIAKSDRRKLSEVALALLERGFAAYQRDGFLFEESVKHRVIETESKAIIDPFIGKDSIGNFNKPPDDSLQVENPPYQANVQDQTGVVMSTGQARTPTKTEQRRANRDTQAAREDAREHQRKKRTGKQ